MPCCVSCGCVSKNQYHPANKSLNVHRASVKAPATVTRTVDTRFSRQRIVQKQPVTDTRVYRRLLSTNRYLPDPAADVIYQKVKNKERDQRKEADELCLPPNQPVRLPSCCDRHRHEVLDVVIQKKKLLYNSPEPAFTVGSYIKDRVEQLAEHNRRLNSMRQYPMSTVTVRWRTPHKYTARILYRIMSIFGAVDKIQVSSSCGTSAIVVFEKLADSCKPVMLGTLGYPGNHLYCQWLYPGLQSRTFHSTGTRLKVHNNEFVHHTK